MAQKEYHNYPIGAIIYPRDNSFQLQIGTLRNWDGIDHSENLYLEPCEVCTEEYKFKPGGIFGDEEYPVVNVKYNGAVYRVSISKFWNMVEEPSLIDYEDRDCGGWDWDCDCGGWDEDC